ASANREQRPNSQGSPTHSFVTGRAKLELYWPGFSPPGGAMPDNGPATITVIREAERPVVDFVGGATYRPIVGDDTGEGLPIRTGIQTSPPGYATRVHSHPYVETLTVLAG